MDGLKLVRSRPDISPGWELAGLRRCARAASQGALPFSQLAFGAPSRKHMAIFRHLVPYLLSSREVFSRKSLVPIPLCSKAGKPSPE